MGDGKINILTDEVVGKISAGEVVERPASVVKELVENAIDANADSIEIEIQSAGQALIRIADNGDGMMVEDMKIACLQHSTSKLKDIDDLEEIKTFGFRGEALSSIAAVSHLDLISHTGSNDAGTHVSLESSQLQKMQPAGREKGTTVEVRNLFFNVPARRKFLKKESTELAEIVSIVGRFIVSYPDIEFKLTHDDRLLLHAARKLSRLQRIKLVLGADIAEHMVRLEYNDGKYAVSGYISRPSSTRKDKRAQIFFVNKRFVKSKVLAEAVQNAYKSLLERGRYPSAVLFLDTPPSEVDVNVHPAKLLVKFDEDRVVAEVVRSAIKKSFEEVKTAEAKKTEHIIMPDQMSNKPEEALVPEDSEVQTEFAYDIKKIPLQVSTQPEKISFSGCVSETISETKNGDLFQIKDCYIVQLGDEGLVITDQHAAHERILYEFFSKIAADAPVDVQNLLFPVRIDLSASEAVIMDKIIDKFATLGFQVEHFGDGSYVVQAVPAVLENRDIKTVVYDIILELSARDLKKIDFTDELIKMTSCRAAIKSGEKLTRQEMIVLLEKLTKCDLPFTCPHGRPTVLDITVDELEKRFRRK